MRIYTRTGDEGETSLLAGPRVHKDHVRLHAYGTVDELNSVIGLALAQGVSEQVRQWLTVIQNELFVVGSDLAAPMEADSAWIMRLPDAPIERLEREIDQMTDKLPPLKHFILPGGTTGAATLHIARTVCRRAERWTVTIAGHEAINQAVVRYLNRLSDWLFTAARYECFLAGHPETLWSKPE